MYSRDPSDKFDITKTSTMSSKEEFISGPHKWTVAWRKADKLNKQAMKDFREGRTMYDVPEYHVRKREPTR